MKLLTLYRALGLKQAIVFVSVLSLIFAFSPFSFNESFADDRENNNFGSTGLTGPTGAIPPEPEPVCEAPNVLIDGVCTEPEPECEEPNVLIDGVCTEPKPVCEAPNVLIDGVCTEPKPVCEAPNVLIDGVCTEPESESEYEGFSVSVDKVDQPYEYGDFVTISGSGAVKSDKIKIKIVSPDGESSTKLSFFSTNDGEFSTLFLVDKDMEHGTYTVIASDSEHKEQTTFFVYTESTPSSGSDYDPEVISHHNGEEEELKGTIVGVPVIDVPPTSGSFTLKVDGDTFTIIFNADTKFDDCVADDLAAGLEVEVKGMFTNGDFLATKIECEEEDEEEEEEESSVEFFPSGETISIEILLDLTAPDPLMVTKSPYS